MDNALIVSSVAKSAAYIANMISAASVLDITSVRSCADARRLLLARTFDLVVINAPLADETGERLARDIASQSIGQVILIVKSEFYDEVAVKCEEDGVLIVAKPVNRDVLWSSLRLAGAAYNRLKRAQAETALLTQKIEDIRIIDKAKYMLIYFRGMREQDAHRYIEKQAMDKRSTRRAVAEEILEEYGE